jgi:hypothetical protein
MVAKWTETGKMVAGAAVCEIVVKVRGCGEARLFFRSSRTPQIESAGEEKEGR